MKTNEHDANHYMQFLPCPNCGSVGCVCESTQAEDDAIAWFFKTVGVVIFCIALGLFLGLAVGYGWIK